MKTTQPENYTHLLFHYTFWLIQHRYIPFHQDHAEHLIIPLINAFQQDLKETSTPGAGSPDPQ